jgi:spermidine/putrescine transport system substrate-binding protein
MKRMMTATALLMATTGLASAEGVLQLYNWDHRDGHRL